MIAGPVLLAAYIAGCLLLVAAFRWLHVIMRTRAMLASLHRAGAIVRDKAIDDLAKEKAIQSASIALLGETAMTTATLVFAFVIAALPAMLGAALGSFTLDEFAMFSLRPEVLLGTIAIFAVFALAARRIRRAG